MRQILYVSQGTLPADTADLVSILAQSRHDNALEGITARLWSDGTHFLQVLEGPRDGVLATFARILADPRHHSLIVLRDRQITARTFAGWPMAHRRGDDAPDACDAQMRCLLINTSEQIRTRCLALMAGGAPPPEPNDATGDTPPLRPRIDRRVGAPFHNAGVALVTAFGAARPEPDAQHDAYVDTLRAIPRVAPGDSWEAAARR